jgi:hypothetical protein
MPRYDESVIKQFAQDLYDEADNAVWQAGLGGAIRGGLLGAVATTVLWFVSKRWGSGLHLPDLGFLGTVITIVPATACAIIDASAAQRRVFQLRLEAQTALCQMMIQRNTTEAVRRLDQLAARTAPRQPAS